MTKFAFLYTGTTLSMTIDGVDYSVDDSHPSFKEILQAVKENRVDDIPNLVSVVRAVNKFGNGKIVVDEDSDVILYNGNPIHNYLADRILVMVREGFTVEPLVNHLDRLMNNPSKRAVDEEYKFLEKGKLPITEDGCFLAYKRVSGNYHDVHSGSVLNKMAEQLTDAERAMLPYTTSNGVTVELVDGVVTVSMPRNQVDDNCERTCSEGLHFCSLEYLGSFWGDHVMILKVDPADVVSIPVDYSFTKGRTWKYQIVGEYKGAITQPAFDKSVVELGDIEDTDELNYSDSVRDDVPTKSQANLDFEDGYRMGYADGRPQNTPDVIEGDEKTSWGHGYTKGYKDGKNHRSRKY